MSWLKGGEFEVLQALVWQRGELSPRWVATPVKMRLLFPWTTSSKVSCWPTNSQMEQLQNKTALSPTYLRGSADTPYIRS